MTGETCVLQVADALTSAPGVRVLSVGVGEATIECTDDDAFGGACALVVARGFRVHEGPATVDALPTANAPTTPAQDAQAGQNMASEGGGGAIDSPASAGTMTEPPAIAPSDGTAQPSTTKVP